MTNQEITTMIDGKEVRVELSNVTLGEFRVKLLDSNFLGTMGSPHIPAFALAYRRYFEQNVELTELGRNRLEEMIRLLLKASELIYEHSQEIHNRIPEIKRCFNSINVVYDAERIARKLDRIALRKEFKNGLLPKKSYLKKLQEMRIKAEIFREIVQDIQDHYLESFVLEFPGIKMEIENGDRALKEPIIGHIYKLLKEK